MNNKQITNIAFILLLTLLTISAIKNAATTNVLQLLTPNFNQNLNADLFNHETEKPEIVLKDFEDIPELTPTPKVNQAIDHATAINYIKTRQLNGTEILELGKIEKIAPHLSQKKKIVIYTSKNTNKDTEAFLEEFAKTRANMAQHSSFYFIPMESILNITEDEITNSHERVIYQLKKDCGLFCIINASTAQLTKMKGSNLNKKSAQIIDVILKGM